MELIEILKRDFEDISLIANTHTELGFSQIAMMCEKALSRFQPAPPKECCEYHSDKWKKDATPGKIIPWCGEIKLKPDVLGETCEHGIYKLSCLVCQGSPKPNAQQVKPPVDEAVEKVMDAVYELPLGTTLGNAKAFLKARFKEELAREQK